MKKIWVLRYNDGTADVWDEEKGPPSWPYVDAFDVEDNLKNLQSELDALRTELSALKDAARPIAQFWKGGGVQGVVRGTNPPLEEKYLDALAALVGEG